LVSPIGTVMKSVAILGGGISGLSAAYYFACLSPKTRITLFESSSRLGGWIQTQTVNGVKFELGPRTLRPEKNVVELLKKLDLQDQIVKISKSHPAAQNRFIWYKDRLGKLPHSLPSIILNYRMPVLAGLASVFLEPFKSRSNLEDESLHDFISRRFDPRIARNLFSAVIGGIYAGDTTKLSARSTLPSLWNYEREKGSVIRGILGGKTKKIPGFEDVSIFAFKNGMQTLPDRLVEVLNDISTIEIKTGTEVERISKSSFRINVNDQGFSHVVSALPCFSQSRLIPYFPHLATVSVHVVNLYYSTENLVPVDGFGYLVPSSEPNPECLLGVIFDSAIFPGGTKLTIMMGGYHYDSIDQIPDEDQVTKISLAIIKKHLGIKLKPEIINISYHKDCIPQYNVGHWKKIKEAHDNILEKYDGKLSVIGNSVTGVGINDCIRGARKTVENLVQGDRITGLEGCF